MLQKAKYLLFPVVFTALVLRPLCSPAGTYLVDRTDLPDHSDINTEGAIAWALARAAADGGGAVVLDSGRFRLQDTIDIGSNVSLTGAGPGATRLVPNHSNPVITNNLGAKQIALTSFGIDMPDVSGAAISLFETGLSRIENIDITQDSGGDEDIWMVEIFNTNRIQIESVNIDSHSNGLRMMHTDEVWDVRNFGDSTLSHIDIRLNEDFTTGMMIAGSETNVGLMNNISATRVEIARRAGVAGGANGSVGTVGIHFRNASRCSIFHADIEGLQQPVINEGNIGNGGGGESNAFVHVFSIGGGSPAYTGINDKNTMLLGGDGDFLADAMQRLPRAVSMGDKHGNIFPVQAIPNVLEPHSDDYQVEITDNRKVFTNEGAPGTITFTLPEPLMGQYLEFTFVSTMPKSIRIVPHANGIIHGVNNIPKSIGAGSFVVSPAKRGYALRIVNTNDRRWQVMETTGIWTVEH